MRDIWFISDTHFNHSNFLKFTDADGKLIRPFDTIEQMNELIMGNWADTVKPGDIIYHLGDVYFGSHDEAGKMLRKLPGRKRLIVGNHDDIKEIVKREKDSGNLGANKQSVVNELIMAKYKKGIK